MGGVEFDPDGGGVRLWFDGNGRLFTEDFVLVMSSKLKGGMKTARWGVSHAPWPAIGEPFLVVSEMVGFP